ncbi:DUF7344 domain-containing protein [Saliphagus infecundisoli]|uniref:DUF7344 domain-containing protein n=1 Tax=Saliphagus infecundisoli TaxID=1849069 RepID=A0ABD5QE47_9EURY|nr:hypothetical protein [Saliphagus infecundisoli]
MRTNQVLDGTDTADEAHLDEQDVKDDVFHTLSNRRRRYVLTYLHTNGGHATVREISEELAAWENQVPRAEVTYKQRKRTYTSLIQIHLGTLHDGGFVDYDSDRGDIELTDDGAALVSVLAEDLLVGDGADGADEDSVGGVRGWLSGIRDRFGSRRE